MRTRTMYLTQQGRERFIAELHELVSVRRPQIAERLRGARELSEDDANEHEDIRVDQAFVEGRIQQLKTLLTSARCIDAPNTGERVQLGSTVTVADLDMDEPPATYRIVGLFEANPRHGLVSDESPTGQALLGRAVGEDVTILAPAGAVHVRIVAIS